MKKWLVCGFVCTLLLLLPGMAAVAAEMEEAPPPAQAEQAQPEAPLVATTPEPIESVVLPQISDVSDLTDLTETQEPVLLSGEAGADAMSAQPEQDVLLSQAVMAGESLEEMEALEAASQAEEGETVLIEYDSALMDDVPVDPPYGDPGTASDGRYQWYLVDFGVYQGYACVDTQTGERLTGYQMIDGNYYLFYDNGALVLDGMQEVNGSQYLIENGLVQTGWRQLDFGIYMGEAYFDPVTGAMAQGIHEIDGQKYLFYENGAMSYSGIHEVFGSTYYVIDTVVQTGWHVLDFVIYMGNAYFDPEDGAMAVGRKDVDGQMLLFFENGALALEGMHTVDGKTYLVENTAVQTGWQVVDLGVYFANLYFDPNTGEMYTGRRDVDGNRCVFLENGALVLDGIVTVYGETYLVQNCSILTGWQITAIDGENNYVYLDPESGVMVFGRHDINGVKYLFLGTGACVVDGLFEYGGQFYYVVNYIVQTGWHMINERNHHFNEVTGALDQTEGSGITRNGIDVSSWQGKIDWAAVKASGMVDFVVVRAVTRATGSTDTPALDPYFIYNVTEAQKYGIAVGAYIYSYATNEAKMIESVDFFLNHPDVRALLDSGFRFELPIFIDYEDPHIANNTFDFNARTNDILQGMIYIEQRSAELGYNMKAGFYANLSWSRTMFDGKYLHDLGYDFWLAQWTDSHTWHTDPDIWQYTSKGSVPGISGNVDMNISYKDYSYNPVAGSPPASGNITVYDQNTGAEVTSTVEDILARIVMSEVGDTSEEVAKAQAIAAHSWLLYTIETHKIVPKVFLGTPTDSIRRWVLEVKNKILTYADKAIMAMYGASHSGYTNSAADYWGSNDFPYLISIHDPNGASRAGHTETVGIHDYKGRANSGMVYAITKMTGSEPSGDPAGWIELHYGSNGYINGVTVNGVWVKADIFFENLLGLYSPNIVDVQYNADEQSWTFTTNGNGHGLGMSQTGARALASQGWDYASILQYYYPGTEISYTAD